MLQYDGWKWQCQINTEKKTAGKHQSKKHQHNTFQNKIIDWNPMLNYSTMLSYRISHNKTIIQFMTCRQVIKNWFPFQLCWRTIPSESLMWGVELPHRQDGEPWVVIHPKVCMAFVCFQLCAYPAFSSLFVIQQAGAWLTGSEFVMEVEMIQANVG